MVDPRFYELVKHLWRGGTWAYYWTPDTDEGKLSFWFFADKPREVVDAKFINIYFGVHPSRVERGQRQRALIETIEAVNCLFAEFDLAEGQDKDHLLESINQLDIPPSVIIFSGGGYHGYWLLEQTYHIDSDEARQRIIDIQYAWDDLVTGDNHVKDLARVLRIPGTYNRKPEYAPNYPQVEIVKFDMDLVYSLDELYTQVESIIATSTAKQITLAQLDTVPVDLDDHTIVEKMRQKDLTADALWRGDISNYNDDHSDADLALCNRLAFWFGRDRQRMDRVFRNSALYRPKWLRDDYREKTLDKAIANCTATYTPAANNGNLGDPQALIGIAPTPVNGNGQVNTMNSGSTQANPVFDLFKYRAEDGGILDAWLDLYGNNWLYVTGYETWHQWAGTHWKKDECQNIQHQIQDLMDIMNQLAKTGLSNAIKVNNKVEEKIYESYVRATKRTKTKVNSVEGMAQAQRAVSVKMLDMNNVLNLHNGTLDLETLALHPHSSTDYLTYCLDYEYDPAAACPRFEQFIQDVLLEEDTLKTDTDLCGLFQELMGYSLTTETKYEIMIWLSGDGGNGKTVVITILQKLLGLLCYSVDFQSIGLSGNYDLAEIPGKRVVFSTESERGGKVAEGYIKRIVSGERINARPIYGKNFEFISVSKIWWAMNDKPLIRDTGNSIWRRLKLIPFNRTFTEQDKDPDLLNKLEQELSGILNFALNGLRKLKQDKQFSESQAVAQAIQDYKLESNPVAQWMNESTENVYGPITLAITLHDDYKFWCIRNGRQSLNSTNFGNELKRLKVARKRTTKGQMYALRLKP
jgi:putative DNA primase/helicase